MVRECEVDMVAKSWGKGGKADQQTRLVSLRLRPQHPNGTADIRAHLTFIRDTAACMREGESHRAMRQAIYDHGNHLLFRTMSFLLVDHINTATPHNTVQTHRLVAYTSTTRGTSDPSGTH